ncbi:MAG TPA: DNA primase [Candidatus Absconditabacterales bacterium]|nr:DNA primase [Candidatus Absconditabacterales bacterium]
MVKIADYIVDNVDIVDVISRRVDLKRAGSNFSGLSPFQNEKTPSFMVSPQKQIFKDFSSGVGGNVITFVMEYEKIDFMDAVRLIAEEQRLDISEFLKNADKSREFADEKEKVKRMHKLTQSFFVDNLKKNDKAMNYLLEDRKLDKKIISQFGIGYAPDSHYDLIQNLKSKGFNEQDLVQSSLAKKGQTDYFGFFRNRITFPIFDTRNNIVGFSARVLDPKDQPKYLNSSEHAAFEKSKILYGLNFARSEVKVHDMLILVEGQMDVIALARLGLPIGVATCGTAVTEQHMKLIKRYTENVYILFDNDEAGKNATIRALKIAYKQDIFPKMIVLPDDIKDVDDMANMENGLDLFKDCLSKSKDAFVQIYDLFAQKYDMSSPIDKQKLFNNMFSLILSVDNYTIQEHYKQVLSDKVGLPYEVVSMQFAKYIKGDGKFEVRKNQNKKDSKSWQADPEIALSAIFYDNILEKYIENKDLWFPFLSFVENVAKNSQENLLKKVFESKESLLEEDIKNLDEMQLWWEKELSGLNNEERRLASIKRIVGPFLKQILKQILKDPGLSADAKKNLLDYMKNI